MKMHQDFEKYKENKKTVIYNLIYELFMKGRDWSKQNKWTWKWRFKGTGKIDEGIVFKGDVDEIKLSNLEIALFHRLVHRHRERFVYRSKP